MKSREQIKREYEYFRWLCDRVVVEFEDFSYHRLFEVLHSIPFETSTFRKFVANDDNRENDGVDLRYAFVYETGSDIAPSEVYDGPCTFLEMLVALAGRCEFQTAGLEFDPSLQSRWFWRLISNLGMDIYVDNDFLDGRKVDEIYEKAYVVIDRTYNKNGKGGLFPIPRSKNDQREVEIWYQMQEYILKGYGVE